MDNKASVVGADLVFIADSEASNVNKEATLTAVMELAAGTVGTSSIENTNGALKVDIANTTAATEPVTTNKVLVDVSGVNKAVTIQNLAKPIGEVFAATNATSALSEVNGAGRVNIGQVTAKAAPVGADMLLIEDTVAPDANVNKMCTITNLAETLAGTMLNAASGVISHEATGQMGVGTIRFGATGDCTSVTIGAVTYPYNGSPDTALGQWAYGASASESATNLAAAINLKTGSPYAATANTDTVHVYAKTVGTAGNVTITRTGGAQPATVENTVGGLAAATKQWCMRAHTVTANDVDTAVLVNIPMPFTPTMFTYSCRSATGAPVVPTDLFTIGTAPARIVITGSGGTHLVATDVVTIMAHE